MTDCLETPGVNGEENFLYLTRAGIDTHQEPVVYMRDDCHVCRSEGFSAQSRVRVCVGERSIIATLNIVRGDFLSHQKAALSESAWQLLGAKEGDKARFKHAPPVESMSHVRGKLYGKPFTLEAARAIITDISQERYSDIQLAAYVTACASTSLSLDETIAITRAMVECGQRFDWGQGRAGAGQALCGRPARQSHHAHRGGHRGGQRPADAQDLVPGHHLAGRHRRHHGDTDQCHAQLRADARGGECARRLSGLGRLGGAEPHRRHHHPRGAGSGSGQ
jgi:hypothetical protein